MNAIPIPSDSPGSPPRFNSHDSRAPRRYALAPMTRALPFLLVALLPLACDPELIEEPKLRTSKVLFPPRPQPLQPEICEDENPITDEDYCPEPHQLACTDPDNVSVSEWLDVSCGFSSCASYSTCLAQTICDSAGACEDDCCSGLVHRTYLEARQECFLYYGVGLLVYADGPCRREARYMECELNCWQDLLHCKRSHACQPFCDSSLYSCVEACQDLYGETPWGLPWPTWPGAWVPTPNG